MKTASCHLILVLASTFGLCGIGTAQADHGHGDYDRLDQLAVRLEAETRTLYGELRAHSFGNPKLWIAAREVGQISCQASHIHQVIHSGVGLQHVHRDVQSLQTLVHHVEEHLVNYKHYRRHVERLDRLTHQMDDCIHDIEFSHFGHSHFKQPSFGGVSIGGKGFSIKFGK